MSQLVIETDTIKKGALYFFAIVGIVIIGCIMGMNIVDHFSSLEAQQTVAPVAATPTPAPAPTIAQETYPANLDFTVLSATAANGHYTVYTTTGQTLYLPDFNSWNSMLPQDSYSATITGAETNGALDVGAVNRASFTVTVPALTGAVQVSQYPYLTEFTVLSTTMANGYYEVLTTTGQTLYMADFNSWNSLLPQDTYSATIIGAEADGALDVGTLNGGTVNPDSQEIYSTTAYQSSYPVSSSVSGAMALPQTWTLLGLSHTGTITLNPDGTGSATIDNYPTITFPYKMASDGTDGIASYRFWSVPFRYDPVNDVITSSNYPGAELVPTG